jgi:6-phosphogluconolactonase (cycloisomerase 2 family)
VGEIRSRWRQIVSAALLPLAVGALLISACTASDTTVQVTNTTIPTLAGSHDIDVIEIDQANHRLYAADRTDKGIDVFDTTKTPARYLSTIPLAAAPNGLAIAPALSRLYVGAANGSVLFVDINPTSPTVNTVVKDVPTGGKYADLLDYAAGPELVFASNGIEGTIATIDAKTGEVKTHFSVVGFSLEQPRFSAADGMLYVTSPDADSLFQLDLKTGMTKNRSTLGGCLPSGMAINTHSLALIACRNAVITWDLRSGTSQRFDQAAGGDIVSYNARADRFIVASPQKTGPSSVALFGGNPIGYIASVDTDGAGKSAAYDETNNFVYTPDSRLGFAGVAGFRPPATTQFVYPSVASILVFAAVVAVILGLFVLVGRGADPALREEPEPRRRGSRGAAPVAREVVKS